MNDVIEAARLQNSLKNPIVALALGFFIPGAGQMYAGSVMWGSFALITTLVLAITIVASPLAFVVWLVSLFYGYSGTKKMNDKLLAAASKAE
ncbi:MAG: TM2 domain-containing membrane protein YozV [Moritella dasanensis]|jgi:TM2 domain-containing membrane protein YozV